MPESEKYEVLEKIGMFSWSNPCSPKDWEALGC
jgi:hypothetical protein